MKLDNVSFPHPVLGLSGTETNDSAETDVMGLFEVAQKLTISKEVSVSVEYSLINSPQLSRLIAEGDAEFACEVSCSKTAFRRVFSGVSAKQEFAIPADMLRDQIVFQYFILAVSAFAYPDEGGWHPDYKGQIFDIERGMVLGYGGEIKHMLERRQEESRKGMSLIEVNCSDADSGPFEVDLNGDVIVIYLPKKTFISFDALYSNNPQYALSFHASLVVPTLLYALSAMASEEGKDYQERKWYQAIDTKLSKDSRFRDAPLSDLTPAKALEISQLLLNCPFSKVTESLLKTEPEEED